MISNLPSPQTTRRMSFVYKQDKNLVNDENQLDDIHSSSSTFAFDKYADDRSNNIACNKKFNNSESSYFPQPPSSPSPSFSPIGKMNHYNGPIDSNNNLHHSHNGNNNDSGDLVVMNSWGDLLGKSGIFSHDDAFHKSSFNVDDNFFSHRNSALSNVAHHPSKESPTTNSSSRSDIYQFHSNMFDDDDSDNSSNQNNYIYGKRDLYKTELCRSWMESGTCRYANKCQFAHGPEELRPVTRHPKYKTEICKTFHTSGTCPYGKRCRFVHFSTNESNPKEIKEKLSHINVLPKSPAVKTSRLPVFKKLIQ